jgi:hypothetical protein
MGRYYNGDIEGKFWFGVQDSNDPEFFGMQEQERHTIDYFVDEEDLDKIKDGLQRCLEKLRWDYAKLKRFFSETNGYNDDMIIDWYKKQYSQEIGKHDVAIKLEWLARYGLGKKIYRKVKELGYCGLEAEL